MSKPIYLLPGEQRIKRHPVWAKDYGAVNHSAREWWLQKFLRLERAHKTQVQPIIIWATWELSKATGDFSLKEALSLNLLSEKSCPLPPKSLVFLSLLEDCPRVIWNSRASATNYAPTCCLSRWIFRSESCKLPLIPRISFSLGISSLEILVKSCRDIEIECVDSLSQLPQSFNQPTNIH